MSATKMTDAEWNKTVDEFIARENENKGKITVPAPPHVLNKEEYDFRIIHKLVTEDLIRQHADAVGDPNPMWRDPGYALGTRWGGIIAPPTFEACIAYGFSGMHIRLPGSNIFGAGNKHTYFKVIRPGDEFRIVDKYLGIEERVQKGRPYRLFLQNMERSYINQRDETAAVATGRMLVTAYPPSKVDSQENLYGDIKRHHFTKEELDVIHRAYDEELEGRNRRGKEILYWEDVVEGEELKAVVKGPLDICDCCARTVANTYTLAFAIKWAAMKEHLDHHPIDPETGEYRFRRDWHYDDNIARLMGMPYAFADGYQNEMVLTHIITNWMGDDGFVKMLDFRNKRINILGDATWLKGRVVKKYVMDGEHLVDLEVWGENQDGMVHTTAQATVKLLSLSG